MYANEYTITEKKNTDNTQSNKNKKDHLLDIKQSLFQELTTQSSRIVKYRDNNDESSYKNSKYRNYIYLRSSKENSTHDFNSPNKDREKYSIKNNHQNYDEEMKQNSKLKFKIYNRNNNDEINKYSKSLGGYNNYLVNSNENFNILFNEKYNNNDDLIYIITTNKNDENEKNREKETEDESETDYERKTPHLALPFCHYHKYNINLPKKYTCNFKKCSCCGFPDYINYYFLAKNTNKYKTKNKYSFKNIKSEKKDIKNSKYRSVLDQYRPKNKNKNESKNNNINTYKNNNVKNINNKNKNIYSDKSKKDPYFYDNSKLDLKDSNKSKSKLSDISESFEINDLEYNIQKPNNINARIIKNDYIIENEKEFEYSNEESSKLELPDDFNIDDENDLKDYKNSVSKSEKKPKTHFSIMYYKRLNKSYKQIYTKDIKDNNQQSRSNQKIKNFELLRE